MEEPEVSQDARLWNGHLVATCVCAQCWGPLVERHVGDTDVVACPKGCQPGGYVTRAWADKRRSESLVELDEVSQNYPQWAKREKLTHSHKLAGLVALFGKED